jgi:hypothetical protein
MEIAQIMAQQNINVSRDSDTRPLGRKFPKQPPRLLPAMPIHIQYDQMFPLEVSFELQGEDVLFRFRSAGSRGGYVENLIDAFSLRSAFLDAKNPREAFELLSSAGYFRHIRYTDEEEQVQERLIWSEFRLWQDLIRLLLTDGPLRVERIRETKGAVYTRYILPDSLQPLMRHLSPKERGWLHAYPDQMVIRSDSPYLERLKESDTRRALSAEIMVRSILEAILATIYVDGLVGVDYRLCSLKDCNHLYEVSSKHDRQYCTQACAHKASVRRRRAEKKTASAKSAKAGKKTTSKKRG